MRWVTDDVSKWGQLHQLCRACSAKQLLPAHLEATGGKGPATFFKRSNMPSAAVKSSCAFPRDAGSTQSSGSSRSAASMICVDSMSMPN